MKTENDYFKTAIVVANQFFFTATYLINDWHDSSKEIHSKVLSKRRKGKFEDGKSLCSEVHRLSEHSPAEWNKCLNIAQKTNSSISAVNWK